MIHGLYVAVEFDENSNLALTNFCFQNNIAKLDEGFHCTLVYSSTWIKHRSFELKEKVKPNSFEFYDSIYGKVLVLKVGSPYLYNRHYQLLREGAMHSFPSYNPHITLGHFSGNSADLDIQSLPILTAIKEFSEKLK